MARHSHWAQIKLKKGALDKKRGKIFTRHARLIEIAARTGGGNPSENATLRMAIENARAENLPKENIERAIKKGTGELSEGEQMQEVMYEGFAPGGVALLIETLTDNKNRTSQTVRNVVQKHGGNLGQPGATSFLFERKGLIAVKPKSGREKDELEIIDAGAEDIEEREEALGFMVFTVANFMGMVKKNLEAKGFHIESAALTYIPKSFGEVDDSDVAQKILDLIEALEEEEDVSNVYSNFEMRFRDGSGKVSHIETVMRKKYDPGGLKNATSAC